MAKLDIRIKESGKDSLRIELGGRSRLLYLIIFLFLSTAVFLSIDFSYDFTSARIGGTLFTFLLILISLGVTITVRSFTIDKSIGELQRNIGLPLGIFTKTLKSFPLGSKPKFLIRSDGHIYSRESMGGSRFSQTAGTAMARGRSKVSLRLEMEESTVTLCEGPSKEEIQQAAAYLSAYLGIPLSESNN
ncbi:hypothetical protein [Spirochaeta isovalerica]|uniref:Uncharacterized protein n=1 Tax=Spirochaeta isovalerica TaxID=150 RepID=A0A841RDQ8_9SPIO|nr:hypothetical protein [Spirochaeta isovalerica]MBB6481357.1 hypothetical protein [Spirochaeta isovalerica]